MSMLGVQDLGIAYTGDATQLQRATAQAGAAVDNFAQRATLSSKQIAAATSGIPAQFTDIVVSLQAGQNPLQVFLQQGGQLKDMFGGIGPAARAMGGYVTSLISPLSLVGAGFAAVGVAAYQGAAEIEAFNRHVILTGGMAGLTGDNMMDMASSISVMNNNITQSEASEKILEIAAAGVRGEEQLHRYAQAAAEFERAGGTAAGQVGEAFKALGKDPLGATMKLTEQMGYLTESVYVQIKSLTEQGRMVEAVRLAQDTYSSVIEARTPGLVENIGLLESAWLGVSKAVRMVWDGMLNIGRDDTLSQQIAEVDKRLAAARANPLQGGGFGAAQGRKRQAEDEATLAALREQQRLSSRATAAVAERSSFEKARIGFLSEGDKYLSSEEKKQREIEKVQRLRLTGVISMQEAAERLGQIEASMSKGASKAAKAAAKEANDFAAVYNKINAKDTGVDASFYKDLEILKEGYQDGRISVEQYQAAVIQLVSTQKVVTEAIKAETDARIAAGVANNAAFDAEFDAIEKKRIANEGQIKTGREMLEQIQFETSLIGLNTLEREQATAMRELERAGVIKGTQAYEAYAEAIKKAMADRDAQKKTLDFWTELDGTAKDLVYDLATGGEDAFKRWGEALEREVYNMLWQMTARKWIFELTGVNVGGGGGANWIDMAQQAYNRYSGGGGGGAGGAGGAAGSGAAVASQYGTTAGSQQTAMLAAQETGMGGAAGTSWMTYAGYAALIAAAVMIAENLYEKGYNRAAVGYGDSATVKFGQNTSYTADNSMGRSTVYDTSFERMKSNMLEGLGMSEKWVDILSGTTRMATLFGRKLSAYGYEANIAGGDAEVGGFARYKGRLRSNKTVAADVDPRDAANFDAIVESTIEGSRAMARAMGLNEAAIDGYTGKIRVNFKNAKTAEEQAERMAEAMDNLNFELLKTASGGKLARDEFKALLEGVQKDIERAGISTEGLTGILASGIVDGASAAQIGEQLSTMILGGIYNTMAQNAFGPVAAAISAQLITPIFTAMAAGVPISQVISKQAISNIVATAQAAAAALNEVFSNADFQAAIAGISTAIGGVAGAASSVRVPTFRAPTVAAPNTSVADAAREKAQLEMEILRLQGNTVEIRRRELLEIKPGNRALQQRVWALEDEKEILDERRDLERELLELQGNTNALRALERDAINESNRALFDQIKAYEDAEKLKDTWSSVIDAMSDEMKRLREEILGTTEEGRAYALAEFTITTAQARAGGAGAAAAAERLPDLARTLVDIASETAGSLSDLRAVQGSTLASLAETQRILGTTYGIELPQFAVGTNYVPRDMVAMVHEGEAIVPKAFNPAAGGGSQAELVGEMRSLLAEMQAMKGLTVTMVALTGRVEGLLDRVTNGGGAMRTKEVAL